MNEEKLKKLKALLETVNDGLSKDEFVSAFKAVIDQVKQIESQLISKIDNKLSDKSSQFDSEIASAKSEVIAAKQAVHQAKQDLQQIVQETREANSTTLAQLRTRALESIDALFGKMRLNDRFNALVGEYGDKVNELNAKIESVPTVEEIVAQIPKDPVETPSEVRDKLESIQEEEEKLAISSIAHLEEKLKDLEKKVGMSRGSVGGFNYGALQLHIVDDETPVGAVDSVNTVFVLNNPPSPASSLKVYLNGQRMRITTDYTFSGSTITFLTAPPTTSILLVDYRL